MTQRFNNPFRSKITSLWKGRSGPGPIAISGAYRAARLWGFGKALMAWFSAPGPDRVTF